MQHDLKIEIIHIKMQHNYFNRLESLIGIDNVSKLKDKTVLIIGIGGVGGYVLESLTRSNVGTIIIVDYDVVDETNINRQILALTSTIGKKKVDVAEKRAKMINDKCNIIKINDKLNKENINELIPNNIDYIVDACDDIIVKVELVKFAINNKIKIISSMGTGNKLNPQLLEITNIWKTKYDPLAKKFRYYLKKNKINYKLPVVSSVEQPLMKTSDFVGSFAPVTNTAGLLLSSYVINDIIKK